MNLGDLIDSIQPIVAPAEVGDLIRFVALAEQEIYRACGLRPQGRPRLRLIRGGRYGEPHHENSCKDEGKV